MPTLLVVHHSPSPTLDELLEAVLKGAADPDIQGVDITVKSALAATELDVLAADGYLLGTPANLGYMSGALKHFFDRVYYQVLHDTTRRPYGLWVHGNNDTTGAVRAVESITTGLGWRRVRPPVEAVGPTTKDTLAACTELGAVTAAALMTD